MDFSPEIQNMLKNLGKQYARQRQEGIEAAKKKEALRKSYQAVGDTLSSITKQAAE